ncbi:MAG: HD domain-containing phosphohydrolase [Pirellulaceae bacterium]
MSDRPINRQPADSRLTSVHGDPRKSHPLGKETPSLADLAERLEALIKSYATETGEHSSEITLSSLAETTMHPTAGTGRVEQRAGQSPTDRPGSLHSFSADASPTQEASHHFGGELTDDLSTARIMIVDDEEVNILTVQHVLKAEGYRKFITTTQPQEAMNLLREYRPDVLLTDIHMPLVSGLDILQDKARDPSLQYIPVIILTATTDATTKRRALELGASDFLTKPLDRNDLVPRVKNALIVKRHYDQKAAQAEQLEDLIRWRTSDLEQSRHELVMSLARAAEHRDSETGNHVLRVGKYAGLIARALGWKRPLAEMLELAAQLHDVGKIGIPDRILFKAGKLDPEEFDIVTRHCAWGKRIIEPLPEKDMRVLRSHTREGESILNIRGSAVLMMAARIAQTHHENWDGSGYPLGLAGEDIPVEGRITAIADVFDALSSKRPYKEALPRDRCFEIMKGLRGKKFDPRILDCFLAESDNVVGIQMDLMDSCPLSTKVSSSED